MIHYLLSLIIFTPLLGSLSILILPQTDKRLLRYVGLITSLITFALTIVLSLRFDPNNAQIQFVEQHPWIESLKIGYYLGVDGLSISLIPLTALLFLLGMVASWEISVGLKGFYSLFLVLETTILGIFSAQDMFLFFVFWEASILPIYFMLGVWGHADRVNAATKFFLFQLIGSVLLLLGMLAIYYVSDLHTFSLSELAGGKFIDKKIDMLGWTLPFEKTVFIMMLVGLAVRMPVFPLHSWFAFAQAEAPTVLSVVLAGLFIKTGVYGLMRLNYSLFPSAAQWSAFALAVAGVINIIYGALCALGQKDMRRLMAYMCLSHIGFVLLGLGIFSSISFHGALLQMLSHGIYAGLLFFLVGILGARAKHFNIIGDTSEQRYGGLISRVPVMAGFFTIGVFSVLGIPGLGSFPAESLIFLGTFPVHRILTILGLIGTVLTAGYLLWMYRRVFLGPENKTLEIEDLTIIEKVYLLPLVLLCVVLGTYPTPFINVSSATLNQMLSLLNGAPK